MKLWKLPHRPTAIISFHNVMTLGLLKALRDSDARVPDDVSVISFGDQPCFPLIDPPLTAVVQPMYALGHDACYLLLKMIQDTAGSKSAAQTRLPIQLIVRDSCHALGAADRVQATSRTS